MAEDKGFFKKLFNVEDPPKEDPPKEDPPKEDPPKEDPPKEDPNNKPQEDLDWRKNLKVSEDQKKALLEFETFGDFVKEYHNQKQRAVDKIEKFKGKSSEELIKWSKDAYNKSEVKLDGVKKKLIEKAAVHPLVVDAVYEEVKKDVVSQFENEKKVKIAKGKEEIGSMFDNKEELENNLGALINSFGMKTKEFTDMLGDKLYDPTIVKSLNKMGAKLRDESVVKIKEGKITGNLPSDVKELEQLMFHWNRKHIFETNSVQRREAHEQLEKVKSKLRSVRKQNKGGLYGRKLNDGIKKMIKFKIKS